MGRRKTKRAPRRRQQEVSEWLEEDVQSFMNLWRQAPHDTKEEIEKSFVFLANYFNRSLSDTRNKFESLISVPEQVSVQVSEEVAEHAPEYVDGMAASVDLIETLPGKQNVFIQTSLTSNDQYVYVEKEDTGTTGILLIQKYCVSRGTQTDGDHSLRDLETKEDDDSLNFSQVIFISPKAKHFKLNIELVSLVCEYAEVQNMAPVAVSSLEDIDNLQNDNSNEGDSITSPREIQAGTTSIHKTDGVPFFEDMSVILSCASTPSLDAESRPESPVMPPTSEQMDADDAMLRLNAVMEPNIVSIALPEGASPPNSASPQVCQESPPVFVEGESIMHENCQLPETPENTPAEVQQIYQLPAENLEMAEAQTSETSNIQINFDFNPNLSVIINDILSSLPQGQVSQSVIEICDILKGLRDRRISEVNPADLTALIERIDVLYPNFWDKFTEEQIVTRNSAEMNLFVTQLVKLLKIIIYAFIMKQLAHIFG